MDEKKSMSIDLERSTLDAPLLPDDDATEDVTDQFVESKKPAIHPAIYISAWILLSCALIVFNKWILTTADFHFPIILTTWHLLFASLVTQIMARYTTLLDSRKKVPMTPRKYCTAVLPIGFFFSLSLICGNVAYVYLSVAFIQILKSAAPIAVLFTMWIFGLAKPDMATFLNVSIIVVGVAVASFGELQFSLPGFLYQVSAVVFEAIRLVMMQRLLSDKGPASFKMDPLVSLFYFAPACAAINAIVAIVMEVPNMTTGDIAKVGYFLFLCNGMLAFLLNVSTVFLIGNTSSLAMTLSGVLKNMLLIGASILIFADPVSTTQFVGFFVAFTGLVVYQTGASNLKEYGWVMLSKLPFRTSTQATHFVWKTDESPYELDDVESEGFKSDVGEAEKERGVVPEGSSRKHGSLSDRGPGMSV